MTPLQKGDTAPGFTLKDQHGNTISLHDFSEKKLIIYFYPKDDTSGCTAQSCNLRDNFTELRQVGFEVVGVSADDITSHLHFADKFQLPFSLLADTERKMIDAYHCWGEKIVDGEKTTGILRKTYVIDEAGIIILIVTDVQTQNHTEQLMALLGIN